jgi:uncharacterized protein YjbJ (UPF0337 family)
VLRTWARLGTAAAHTEWLNDEHPLVATTNEEDSMSGTTDKAKGRIKEAAGALTGDDKLKREGKRDQVAGKVKDAVDRTVDRVKNAAND